MRIIRPTSNYGGVMNSSRQTQLAMVEAIRHGISIDEVARVFGVKRRTVIDVIRRVAQDLPEPSEDNSNAPKDGAEESSR